ncbi:hypothetical protein KBD34_00365 [Patescibacteria group bacterium]|nr:hypothetical protein [Patescibacteria group bacterium]
MSNIGYTAKEIMRIVYQVLQRGVKTVYCTLSDREYVIFMNAADPKGRHARTHYAVSNFQTSYMNPPETVYEGMLGSPDVSPVSDVSQMPIRVRLCGNDQAAACGTLVEITRAS